MSYAEIMDKAETVLAVNQAARRGLEAGRRESDREIEVLRASNTELRRLLIDAIGMIEKGEFTEQEMTALEIGLEVIGGR